MKPDSEVLMALAEAADKILNPTGEREHGIIVVVYPYNFDSTWSSVMSNGQDIEVVMTVLEAQVKAHQAQKAREAN